MQETNPNLKTLEDVLGLDVYVMARSGNIYATGKLMDKNKMPKQYSSIMYGDGYGSVLVVPTADGHGRKGIRIYPLSAYCEEQHDIVHWRALASKTYKWIEDVSCCSFSVFPDGTFVVHRAANSDWKEGETYSVKQRRLPYISRYCYDSHTHDVRIHDCCPSTQGCLSDETKKIVSDAGFYFNNNTDDGVPQDMSQLLYAMQHPCSRRNHNIRERAFAERLNGNYDRINDSDETMVVDCGKWVALAFNSKYCGVDFRLCIQWKKSNGDQRINVLSTNDSCCWLNPRSVFDDGKTQMAMLDSDLTAHQIAHAVSQPEAMAILSQVSHLSFVLKSALPLLTDETYDMVLSAKTQANKAIDDYVIAHDRVGHRVRRYSYGRGQDCNFVESVVGAGLQALLRDYYMDMTYESTIGKVLPEFIEWRNSLRNAPIKEEQSWETVVDHVSITGAETLAHWNDVNTDQFLIWSPKTLVYAKTLCILSHPDYSKHKPWQQCGIGKTLYYALIQDGADKNPYNDKDDRIDAMKQIIRRFFGLSCIGKPDAFYAHYAPFVDSQSIDEISWVNEVRRFSYNELPVGTDLPLFKEANTCGREMDMQDICWYQNDAGVQKLVAKFPDAKFVALLHQEILAIKHMRSMPLFKGSTADNVGRILQLMQDYGNTVRQLIDRHVEGSDLNWPKTSEISQISQLQHLHDQATRFLSEANSKAAKEEADRKNQVWDDIRDRIRKDLEFVDDKTPFLIKLPTRLSELTSEGIALSHCVGTYVNAVAEGRDIIMFIRRKDDENTPLLTVDLVKDDSGKYRIRQVHGKYNSEPTEVPQAMEFLHDWVGQRKKVDETTVSESYGALCHN